MADLNMNLNMHFFKFMKYLEKDDPSVALEEMATQFKDIAMDFENLTRFTKTEAFPIVEKYSQSFIGSAACFVKMEKICCAKRNLVYLYQQLRDKFFDSAIKNNVKEYIRFELRNTVGIYLKVNECQCKNAMKEDLDGHFLCHRVCRQLGEETSDRSALTKSE
jgi:hypothetical protein